MRFQVEIAVGVSQSDLAQAERGYKRLGDSADAAYQKVNELNKKGSKETEELAGATIKAAASFEKFAKSIDSGGKGAEQSLARVAIRTDELRAAIDRAQKEGSPVPPAAIATLQALERETEGYIQKLGMLRAQQEAARREVEQATIAQGGFKGGMGSTADMLGLVNPRLEQMALHVGLVAGGVQLLATVMKQSIDTAIDWARELGADGDAMDALQRRSDSYMQLSGGIFKAQLEDVGHLVKAVHGLALEYGNVAGVVVAAIKDPIGLLKNLGKAFTDNFVDLPKDEKKAEEATRDFQKALVDGAAKQQQLHDQEMERRRKEQEDAKRRLAEFQQQIATRDRLRKESADRQAEAAEREKRAWESLIRSMQDMAVHQSGIATRETAKAFDDVQRQNEQWAAALSQRLHAEINLWKDVESQLHHQIDEQVRAGVEEIKQKVELGFEIKANFEGPKDQFQRQLEAIFEAAGLTAKEKGAFIAAATNDFWNNELGLWADGLATLGHYFGGFLGKLADFVSQVQRAASDMSQSFSNIARASGGSSSTVAMAGTVGTVIGIFAAVYSFVDKIIKTQKAHTFGVNTDYGILPGTGPGETTRFFTTQIAPQSHAIISQIQDTLKAFEEALGVWVTGMEKITIKVRADGKYVSAQVGDVFLGEFHDVNDAIQAALAYEITSGKATFEGLTELMKTAMQVRGFPTLDDALKFLQQLKEISDMGKLEGVAAMEELAHHIEELFQTLNTVSLNAADAGEYLQGVSNLIHGLTGGLSQLYNDLTGHKQSLAEYRAAQMAAFNAQRAIVLAQLTLMMQEIKTRIALYQAQQLTGGSGSGGGGGHGPDGPPAHGAPGTGSGQGPVKSNDGASTDAGLQSLLDALQAIQDAINGLPPKITDPNAIEPPGASGGGGSPGSQYDRAQQGYQIIQQLLDFLPKNHKYDQMRLEVAQKLVQLEFLKMEAELKAYHLWTAAVQQLFHDAEQAALAGAGKPQGAGGGDKKQGVKDFIRDRTISTSEYGLSDFQRQLNALNREYAEQIKNAGKDRALRQQLLDLQQQETQHLREQFQQQTQDAYDQLVGNTNAFTELHKKFDDAKKAILEAGYGADQAAQMIRDLTDAEQAQAEVIGQQMLAGLFEGIAKYATDAAQKEAFLAKAADIKYQLELYNMKAQVLLLRGMAAALHISLADLDEIDAFLNGLPLHLPGGGTGGDSGGGTPPSQPGTTVGQLYNYGAAGLWRWDGSKWVKIPSAPAGGGSAGGGGTTATDPLQAARDLLAKYRTDNLDRWHKALKAFNDDWTMIFATLGRNADTLDVYNQALASMREEFLSGLRDFRDNLLGGAASGGTIEQQYNAAIGRYGELRAMVAGGDLSQADALRSAAEVYRDLAAAMFGTSTGGFASVRDEILRDLSGILGDAGTNVVGGPSWFAQANDKAIASTDNVASVVDLSSRRQEALLQTMISENRTQNERVVSTLEDLRGGNTTLGFGG